DLSPQLAEGRQVLPNAPCDRDHGCQGNWSRDRPRGGPRAPDPCANHGQGWESLPARWRGTRELGQGRGSVLDHREVPRGKR
ncbi:unnamed protein product, partial [Ascophyllum nodosum]